MASPLHHINRGGVTTEEHQLSHKLAIFSGFLRNEISEVSSTSERCEHLQKRISMLEEALLEVGRLEPARRCLQNICAASGTFPGGDLLLTTTRSISTSPTHSLVDDESEKNSSLSSPPAKRPRIIISKITSLPPTPCLRCKILKKRCDTLLPSCNQCPTHTRPSSTTDEFWKVLSCIRSPLISLSTIFCPLYSRSTTRNLLYPERCGIESINFTLTQSRVSTNKRRRIQYLIQCNESFSCLSAVAWDNENEREALSFSAAMVNMSGKEFESEIPTEDYEAAWAVLQCVVMDKCYLEKTAYNFFTLMQLGNEYSAQEPAAWELYIQARKLLRQSVELHLLERLCSRIASGNFVGPPPFTPASATPNTLVLVDLLNDVEKFLTSFEKTCSLRGKLAGHLQLGCFYALLVFGIAKSILIDAYAVRPEYENPNPWTENDAIRITSAYKVLVSVFCWASNVDAVQQEVVTDGSYWSEALITTREMVHSDLWEEREFKGSKDFLLALGSCSFSDGSYNGFFVQKFRRERLETFVPKPQAENAKCQAPSFMMNAFSLDRSLEQSPTPSESTVQESPKFVFVGQDENPKRHSRRKGALDAATLENAREVRKIGACWNCWAMKCSEGDKCDRCEHKLGSKSYRLCNRGSFNKFTEVFFPDFLSSSCSLEETKAYIAKNTSGVSDTNLDIEIVWNQVPMTLRARIFTPVANGVVQSIYQNRAGESLGVGSLPVGLFQDDVEFVDLERNLAQLRCVTRGPSFLAQVPEMATFPLSTSLLKILLNFHRAEQSPILENSLMLYQAICATARPVMFTDSTARLILEKIGSPSSLNTAYSSRILNRQIKHVMFKICRHLLTQVLDELERIFRKRAKQSWPILFATLTLLCFCIEEIQVMIVVHAHTAITPIENEPQNSCHALEDIPYGQLTSVFHTLYRTMKADSGGFNPFRENIDPAQVGFSESAVAMVHEIKSQIFDTKGKDILRGRRNPLTFGREFSERNAGHLVAGFLLSFIKPAREQKS